MEKAGYGVALGEAVLPLQPGHLADANDARRLEKTLAATVNVAAETAAVQYVPTLVTQAELRRAMTAAGFAPLEVTGTVEDAERMARQRHLLLVGLLSTVPLLVLSMGRDLVHNVPGWHMAPPWLF